MLIKDAIDEIAERAKEKKSFEPVYLFVKIEYPLARKIGTTIYILWHAATSINKILQDKIRGRKLNHKL